MTEDVEEKDQSDADSTSASSDLDDDDDEDDNDDDEDDDDEDDATAGDDDYKEDATAEDVLKAANANDMPEHDGFAPDDEPESTTSLEQEEEDDGIKEVNAKEKLDADDYALDDGLAGMNAKEKLEAYDEQAGDGPNFLSKLGFSAFRSAGQKRLVEEVAKSTRSIMGILPTGAGKTLSILYALTEENCISLVIYPLRAIYDDVLNILNRDYAELRCKWSRWDPSVGLKQLFPASLVLVTAEQAKSKLFLAQLAAGKDLVKRIIFDEAPVFLSQEFRLGLSSIPLLIRSLTQCPFILLTATLAAEDEDALKTKFCCPGCLVVRSPTVRDNIVHESVKWAALDKFINPNDGLTIVFVRSMKQLDLTAQLVASRHPGKIVVYHGSLKREERESSAQQWKTGMKPVMVATTAFAFGVNSSSCNTVIHLDQPYDLATYAQASGRAGRAGQPSRSIVIARGYDNPLFDSKTCRLVYLSSRLDAKELQWKHTCGRCDICLKNGSPVNRVPIEFRRDLVKVTPGSLLPKNNKIVARHELAMVRKITKFFIGLVRRRCMCCFVISEGRDKCTHGIVSCPLWRLRCYRCGVLGCNRKTCKRAEEISNRLKKANLCVSCALPPFLMETNLHLGEFSMGRKCTRRDTILPCFLILWQLKRCQIECYAKKKIHSFDEYISWGLDTGITGLPEFLRFSFWLVS